MITAALLTVLLGIVPSSIVYHLAGGDTNEATAGLLAVVTYVLYMASCYTSLALQTGGLTLG